MNYLRNDISWRSKAWLQQRTYKKVEARASVDELDLAGKNGSPPVHRSLQSPLDYRNEDHMVSLTSSFTLYDLKD